MIVLFRSSAGVTCNIINYLKWCINSGISDKVIFYYFNKYYSNGTYDTSYCLENNLIYNLIKLPASIENIDLTKADYYTDGIGELNLHMIHPDIFKSNYGYEIGAMNKELFLESQIEYFTKARYLFNSVIRKNLEYSDYLINKIKDENSFFFKEKVSNKKILAIMIRDPVHYYMHKIDINIIIEELDEKMKGYDYILPITIVHDYYEAIKNHFNDKCIVLNRSRNQLFKDWVDDRLEGSNLTSEVENVLIDIYLASQCDYILGSNSSLFMMALFLNPNVDYSVIKCLQGIGGA